ncbi:hypothetical protein ACJX0J_009950, partial [Zea mays]
MILHDVRSAVRSNGSPLQSLVGPGHVQVIAQRDGPHRAPNDVVCRHRGLRHMDDQLTMDIEVEEGNVDVGNTAEPSYEVVASSGCSAHVPTNDTDEHKLDIESEDSKVSVGNAAKQSQDVVGVGIDCIFNPVKVSTEANLGPQP